MRETKIVLEDAQSMANGVRVALGDLQRVIKVRIAPTLHSIMVKVHANTLTAQEVNNNPALKSFQLHYDFDLRKEIPEGEPCAWIYGAKVFEDPALDGYTLVIESEPMPALDRHRCSK